MSLKEIRICDYIILLCDRMTETRRFYADVMGFPIGHDGERWVEFRVGSTLLTLRPRGPWIGWEDGPAVSGSAAVQLAFRVPPSAIEACHAEFVAKGAEIVSGPIDLPRPRHRAIFVRDPEGNIVEVYAEF